MGTIRLAITFLFFTAVSFVVLYMVRPTVRRSVWRVTYHFLVGSSIAAAILLAVSCIAFYWSLI